MDNLTASNARQVRLKAREARKRERNGRQVAFSLSERCRALLCQMSKATGVARSSILEMAISEYYVTDSMQRRILDAEKRFGEDFSDCTEQKA